MRERPDQFLVQINGFWAQEVESEMIAMFCASRSIESGNRYKRRPVVRLTTGLAHGRQHKDPPAASRASFVSIPNGVAGTPE
jgi:hypothetical protein